MIGSLAPHAQTYLLCLAIATTLVFTIPILLVPLHWARVMRWHIPDHTHLALYFGRCLGVLALVVEFLMFRAGLTGEELVVTFEVTTLVFAGMVLLHLYGAVQRIQPITETLEIGLWAAMVVANGLFFPTA